MAVDLQPYKIGTGDQNYPVKYDAALDHIQGEINSGLSQIGTNLTTLSAQISSEIDTATGALSTQITGELNTAVGVVEGYRDQAATSAGISTTQAGIATTKAEAAEGERIVAEQSKNQIMTLQGTLEGIVAGATAIVVSGDVSYGPAANQVPLARANGSIDPQWIKGALKPVNWIEAGSATSGVLIPDDTETMFTAQMARFIPPIFIPETMTEEIVIYDDAPLSICITTDKKIRVNHYGAYESEPLNVNNDWVEFAFGKADNQTDTVTIYFIANGRQIGSTIVGDYSDLAVRAIFNDGAVAGFYGCASPAHQKQNSTATERIHAPGDPVGYDYDLSPNGVDAPQPTSTARPLIGRQPLGGKLNELYYTEQLDAWSNAGEEVTAQPGVLDPEGGLTAFRLTGVSGLCRLSLTSMDLTASSEHKLKIWVKYVEGGSPDIRFFAGDDMTVNIAITPEWVEKEISITTGAGNLNLFQIRVDDIGKVVDVWHPSLTLGSVAAPYQKVGLPIDATQTGIQDVWFHQYGLDDVTPRTIPAITDGTIIIGGTKGIWIDTLTFAGGTFSLEDGGYTGAPARLYNLIGDLVGWFVADATLTELQETAVVNWLKQKGCPGVFELGANSVVDSGADEPAKWYPIGAGWEVSGGKLRRTGSEVGGSLINQTASPIVTAGKTYKITWLREGGAFNSIKVTVRDAATGGIEHTQTGYINTVGVVERIFTATSTGYLAIYCYSADASITVDDITLEEITLNTGA